MYQRCPRQYFFRYKLGLVEPPGVALCEGSAHHAALAAYNTELRDSKHPPLSFLTDAFVGDWKTRQKEVAAWENETPDSVQERGLLLLKRYYADLGEAFDPIEIEQEIQIEMDGVPVLGYVDLLAKARFAKTRAVYDYKVVGRRKSQDEAEGSLQLATYTKAKKVRKGAFVCLQKSGAPPAVVGASFNSRSWAWASKIYAEVSKAVSLGVFPPCDPASWMCGPRWCGYWSKCRGQE